MGLILPGVACKDIGFAENAEEIHVARRASPAEQGLRDSG